jgi:hypothetical protein
VLARGGAALSSPKQSAVERQRSVFPYYAGFSEAFVRDVFDALQVSASQVVLDPWNGSGTTTAVARRAGMESVGIDLNPALAVVARARLATPADLEEARLALKDSGRSLSQAFLREACSSAYQSSARSILLLAIFRIARRRLRERDHVGTNPTWWQSDLSEVKKVIASISKSRADEELTELEPKLLKSNAATKGAVSLVIGDVLAASLPKRADIIVTSPPYLTRIDYVKATLPELLVLSMVEDISIDKMRRTMIGSPVVGQGPNSVPRNIGEYAKVVLSQIGSHTSKASETYYLAFFTTYISKMLSAFDRLKRIAAPRAKMVLVVQGSHYKEIFVDLAQLSIELAASAGFNLVSRADFRFKQSFAQLNPRANGYNLDTAQETALLLERSI